MANGPTIKIRLALRVEPMSTKNKIEQLQRKIALVHKLRQEMVSLVIFQNARRVFMVIGSTMINIVLLVEQMLV
ncbi:MAG: hypothetical protein EBY29_16840 [Planctomycetes bacterium]|nr:hypothetical protein [Planctomycetota bacterium]